MSKQNPPIELRSISEITPRRRTGPAVGRNPIPFDVGALHSPRTDLAPSTRRAKQHLSRVGLEAVTYELLAHGHPAVALVGHPDCNLAVIDGKMTVHSIYVCSVDPERRTGKNGGSFYVPLRFNGSPPAFVIVYIHGCASQLVIPYHAFPAGTTWPTVGRYESGKLTAAAGYEPFVDAWYLLAGEEECA